MVTSKVYQRNFGLDINFDLTRNSLLMKGQEENN
jgi:hypothetical protein